MPKTAEPTGAPPLAAASPADVDAAPRLTRAPYVPWVAAAVIGAGGTVLLGWTAIGAVVAVGWLTMPTLPPAAILDTIAQLWMGAHGVPFTLEGVTIGLTPLGLSVLLGVAMSAVTRYAIGHRATDEPPSPATAAVIAGVCMLAYALGALLLATLVGTARQALGVFLGALLIGGIGSLVGAWRASGGLPAPAAFPAWVRGVPAGIVGGLGGLLGASLVTLALAIVSHLDQIRLLQSSLAPDPVGAALLIVSYLAYAPTLVAWAGAYALGGGVQVGVGTLLTPWTSQLGLLPGLPIAGALPTVPPQAGWLLLASGPAAGLAAGLLSVRRLDALGLAGSWRPAAAAGGASALLAGLAWAVFSALTRGSLGAGRLAVLGPRFPELLWCATAPTAAAGALAAAAWVLWRSRRVRKTAP